MASIHKPVVLILFLFCQTKARYFRTETTLASENIPSHEKSVGLETNLTKQHLANNPSQPNGQGEEKPKLSIENIPKPNVPSKLSKEDIQKPQQLETVQNPKDSRTNVNVALKNDKPAEGEKKTIGVEKVEENGTNSQNEVVNRGISQNIIGGKEKGNEKKEDERDGKKKETIENDKGIDNINDKQKVIEVIADEKKLKQEISYLKKRSRSSLEKMPSGEIEILDKELDDYIKILHIEMEKRNKKRKTEKEEAQIKEIQGEIKQAKVLDKKLEQIEEIKEEKEKTNNGEATTMNQNQPLENEGQQQQHYVADYFWPHHPIYDHFEQQQPMIGYSPYSYQNQEPIKIQSYHSHEPFKFSANSNDQQGKNSLNKHKNRPKMNKKSLELNQKPTNNVAVPSSAPTTVSESATKNLPPMDSNMSDPDHAKRVLDWERVWKWAETNNQVNKATEQKRKEETNSNNKESDNSKQLQNGGGIDSDKNKPIQKEAGESARMVKEKTAVTDNIKSGNLPPKTSEPTKEELVKPILKSAKVETQKPVSKPEETLKPKSGDEKSNSKNNATNNAAATLAKESQSKGNDGIMKEATKQNEKESKNVESKKSDDSDNKVKNIENSADGKAKTSENLASVKGMTNEVSASGKGMTNEVSASGKEKNKENSAVAKGKNVTDPDKNETAKQTNKKQKIEGEAPKTAPATKKIDEQQQGIRPKKKGGKGNSQKTTIQNNINSSSSSNSSEEDPKAKNGKCETTKVKNEGEITNKKKRKRGEGFGYDQSESDESDEPKAKRAKVGNGQATADGVYIG